MLAWQINGAWKYEPDLAKSSEVHVRFVSERGGRTRVEMEHRHIERAGEAANAVRTMLGGEGGWTGILRLFAERVGRDAADDHQPEERT